VAARRIPAAARTIAAERAVDFITTPFGRPEKISLKNVNIRKLSDGPVTSAFRSSHTGVKSIEGRAVGM